MRYTHVSDHECDRCGKSIGEQAAEVSIGITHEIGGRDGLELCAGCLDEEVREDVEDHLIEA